MLRASWIAFLALATASPAGAQDAVCVALDGAIVVNEDGEYIGKIANKYVLDSIFNKYGTYGSRYSTESIWNKYGKNGSEYQINSAFNKYTVTPPKIIKNRQVLAFLSSNRNLPGAVSPLLLGAICYDYEP